MGFRQSFLLKETNDYLDAKIHNLHCTNDRESSQKSHCSSNCREHVHKLGSSIFGDSVKLWGFEIDFHISHLWSYINIYSYMDSKLLNEQIMTWYLPLSSDGSLIAPLYWWYCSESREIMDLDFSLTSNSAKLKEVLKIRCDFFTHLSS